MNTSLMKFVRIIILSALIPLLIACNPPQSHSVNYYFDPVSGNDTNTGIAAGCPFKSLARIRTLPLKPGDSVLLKSGALFTEPLYICCKGDSGNPVVVGKYGGASRPCIWAGGQSNNAVHVYNSEHVVVRDLEISNKDTRIRYNISINDGLRNFKLKEHYFSPVIHCTGPIENTVIEKNIFYLFKKPDEKIDRTLISLTDWSGYPDSTIFRENYIFAEESYRAADIGKSTRTHFEDNLFVGEMTTMNGFESRPGPFNKHLWYTESDENWTNLLQFIRNKTVTVNGKEWKVTDIIGADPKK